jgi:hypothetical protein
VLDGVRHLAAGAADTAGRENRDHQNNSESNHHFLLDEYTLIGFGPLSTRRAGGSST